MSEPVHIAAIDAGSNAVRLSVARAYSALDIEPLHNERYSLRFSMFQKGVPFYTQDCKENESNDRCINEAGGVFSKPLEVNFVTNKKYDNRPAWQKMNDFNLFDYFHRSGNQAQPGDDDANNPGAGYEMD